jgi:hypothetical protein
MGALSPEKWVVLSWTTTVCTLVGIYHNRSAAIAAVQAVVISNGTIGAGIHPLVGSADLECIQGVPQF